MENCRCSKIWLPHLLNRGRWGLYIVGWRQDWLLDTVGTAPMIPLECHKNISNLSCQYPVDHRKSKRVPSLAVWTIANCRKFLKRWEYHTTWPASWEICMQVKKQQLELDMEQQTVSKSGKEYVKTVYCHPAYLTYMQSTSWEMLDWIKHKLESRLPGEISITSICRWYHSYDRKQRTKEPLDESERGEWKSWLKTQHSEN